MIIAVTSQGHTMESQVDSRFGRASMFIIYDTETNTFKVQSNAQNINAAQGAGLQAAQTVARAGAECVITGHCGPKAFRTLQEAGIKVYTGVQGTVAQAIDSFKKGELHAADAADVDPYRA